MISAKDLTSPANVVLAALGEAGLEWRASSDSGDEWTAQCPAHEDRSPSLSLKAVDGDGGDKLLVNCFAGCGTGDVIAALGLRWEDLYAQPVERKRRTPVEKPQQEAVMTAELLARLEGFVSRYVVMPGQHETTAVLLYALHTHAFRAAHATPILTVLSPEKRSTKTRLLEVLELVVRRPWRALSASEAALYRKIEADSPTFMLDEVDSIWAGNSERNEALRAIVNGGNRPGSVVTVCVGKGADISTKDFSVFCPKVLAGIDTGRLPDTIRDRSIEVRMKRKTPSESVARFRYRQADQEAAPLRAELERWAEQRDTWLHAAEPPLPNSLNDRAAEAWEPLLAIADLAENGWPDRARSAALALSGLDDLDDLSFGGRLLAALREVFGDAHAVATQEILEKINEDDELPFGAWKDGRGLDSRGLARLLKPYEIRSRTVRLPDGATPKGFRRDQFEDAWARYAPQDPPHPPQAPQPNDGGKVDPPQNWPLPPHRHTNGAADCGAVADSATLPPHEISREQGDVADVADVADLQDRALELASRFGYDPDEAAAHLQLLADRKTA